MSNEEWIEMFRIVPESQHDQLVITLQGGVELVADTLFRFHPNFLVMRGRQVGTTEDGRAYFVPYHQMLCFRIERMVKLQELYRLHGEEPPEGAIEDRLGEEVPRQEGSEGSAPAPKLLPQKATRAAAPHGSATMLAGAAAPDASTAPAPKNNLLERIRAARATGVATTRQNTQ